jgi:hypothetical protein
MTDTDKRDAELERCGRNREGRRGCPQAKARRLDRPDDVLTRLTKRCRRRQARNRRRLRPAWHRLERPESSIGPDVEAVVRICAQPSAHEVFPAPMCSSATASAGTALTSALAQRGGWSDLAARVQGQRKASANFSDGAMNASVLRGRSLSSPAAAARSAWL